MPALTTLTDVKELLSRTDTVHDSALTKMIAEASVMLENALGRSFTPEDGVTKAVSYHGQGWVNVAPHDLRAVTAVTYDSDGDSPVVLAEGDWRLRGQTGNGTFRDLFLPGYTGSRVSLSDSVMVEITGDWGFAEVPEDVERGVKVTVKTWLREGAVLSADGDIVRFERVGRVPQDVLDGLSHYRLPQVY